ncbi:hypothetical protein [Prosthecobacter sp.]|uniref:hypothetical protein n=1 Tax=Prosthecobacter sp. TaxID=1965333 RepID=UPI001D68B28C|nr:hypothetical protein [Prosthecobacter sp.]MCB1279738.1 hypothetical protein [Prosthecobacter sp.]
MKHILLLLNIAFLSACQTPANYEAGSVAEARAYARRAVELGVAHKGGEEALVAEKSQGKPLENKWNPKKIDSFLKRYAADHPQLVAINRAADAGKISEKEHASLIVELKQLEEERAARDLAERQAAAAALNQTANMMDQESSFRMNSALMRASPSSSSYSGFGGGFGGFNGYNY